MENEELIREDMEKTRESLTEKLETLEKKLVDSVHGATSAVKETMSTVKETMHDSVETVKEAVDIPAHVERQPWLMFGGAVLAGYVLGNLLDNRKEPATSHSPSAQPFRSNLPQPGNGHSKREKREQAAQPKKESWLAMLEPEVNHLKGLALGVALGTVREMLTEQIPPHLAGELRGVIDAVTKKVGGEPLPSADFEFAKSKESSGTQAQAFGQFEPDQPRF